MNKSLIVLSKMRGQSAFMNLLYSGIALAALLAVIPVLNGFIDTTAADPNSSDLQNFFIYLIPVALVLGVVFAYLSRSDPTRQANY